jgi:hypothetical protein
VGDTTVYAFFLRDVQQLVNLVLVTRFLFELIGCSCYFFARETSLVRERNARGRKRRR